ncbi:hypothetical protein C8N26_1058 [Tenacibaculum lutimaris]|uniref:Cadherin domain-containing protein n=1 Tax=Tenacibaculum lutimaris TaxID=285258 RepID=A0A420E2W9_9FLAO|nr:hypothetical protein [Tenacibaculum lutimaris]RKF04390.1 hypothetical protein C8N26_1058 [Tenacibaculum lutimaris]
MKRNSSYLEEKIKTETKKNTKYILLFTLALLFISCGNDDNLDKTGEIVTLETKDMSFNINENPFSGAFIGTIKAETNQGSISYSVIKQTPENSFMINSNTGELTVDNTSVYDYETATKVTGIIEVSNGEIIKKINITINIDNLEDVYTGDVHLKTQEEVNEFASYKYNEVNGDLTIGDYKNNLEIKDLSLLIDLKTIRGSLFVFNNPDLKNLEGLNNISTIYDICGIGFNNSLADISSLKNLTKTGSLLVTNCPLLKTIDCFSKINSINGYLEISRNPSLESLNGLQSINTVTGRVDISINNKLVNISELTNLKNIGDFLALNHNNSLTDIKGLNNLESIGRGVQIMNNENLTDFNSLNKITTLPILEIRENPNLQSINGFSNLKKIEYYFIIYNNNSLTTIDGLGNLESVEKLNIEDNILLDNFCSLNKLVLNNFPSTNYLIRNNKFNPSLDDLKNGKCNI